MNNFINTFSNLLKANLFVLKKQKKILLQYVQQISDYPIPIPSVDSSNQLINFLSMLKEKINLVDSNISKATDLLNKLDTFETSNTLEDSSIFSDDFTNVSNDISNCIINLEDFFISSMNFIKLDFEKPASSEPNNISNTTTKEPANSNESNTQTANLLENTLIISEMQGKVFLPYTVDNLNKILEENKSKYKDINEVIEKEFVIPYEIFKNPIFSRFKEAFKLIRYKEHGSIKEAFDLGMELLLNYNLHPAIISACRNIDELDIYLDYLENNETDKFSCFDIKFEIAPILKK